LRRPLPTVAHLVPWLDLAATTLFALEGADLAAVAGYDIFGVLVVAVASALGGGTIRDLLIGDVPPASIRNQRYLWAAIIGGAAAFAFHTWVHDIPSWLLTRALPAPAKALERKLVGVMCVLIGTLTAVGGGIIRDLLLSRSPVVLRLDIYATAAIVGATVMVLGTKRGVATNRMMVVGAVVCFALRVVAAWRNWSLPTLT
jgi:uncharacterized membrane protein YeiH